VIGAAFAITTVVYLALAAVTVAVLGGGAGTGVPLAGLLSRAIGGSGSARRRRDRGAADDRHRERLPGRRRDAGADADRRARAGLPALVPRRDGGLRRGRVAADRVGDGVGRAAVRVSSAFFLVVYLGCMAAAYRLLGGAARVAAVVAAGAIAVVLGYARWAAVPALVVAVGAALSARSTAQVFALGRPSRAARDSR
jgi:amino acid efflux transporter